MIRTSPSIQASPPELTDLPVRLAAVVRIDGPMEELPRLLGEAFDLTAGAITGSGAAIAGPPFARYLSFGDVISAEVGFPYTGELVATGRVYRTELPGGRAVVATHAGPYEELADTWAATRAWLDAHAIVPSGTPWESYLTDPTDTPPVTEIVFPVQAAR